jgi:hypothetical protein
MIKTAANPLQLLDNSPSKPVPKPWFPLISRSLGIARDLAEQALQVAGDDPTRRRMAWYTFADIYHRCHNQTEALLAMACGRACGGNITLEQAWYETLGLIRLFRDMNMTAWAGALLPRGKRLMKDLGVEQEYAHRLTTIELGIRLRDLTRNEVVAEEDIFSLIRALEENCSLVLAQDDELAPVAIALAQSLHLCRHRGFKPPPSAMEVLEDALAKLREPTASIVRTLSVAVPTAADLHALTGRLEPARHAEDVGFDMRSSVLVARRLLDGEEVNQNAAIAAFGIELLADQGIERPLLGDETERAAPAPPKTIDEVGVFAAELSKMNLDVHLFGISEAGLLNRVSASAGVLGAPIREPKSRFSSERLEAWSERGLPFRFGFEENNPNAFYSGMEALGLEVSPSPRGLLVMDTMLQHVPPNLVLVSGELAGRTTAMAAAPSLSWLRAAQKRDRSLEGSTAWIPTGGGERETLAMLADRLTPSLRAHGIELHINSALPENLTNKEMVIITAHGGIVPEGRFFQVVSDDAEFKVTSAALARSIRNVNPVILFVCSGGRLDKHPWASTTVGLAKELLDRGCSTVVGSPWPLHSSVPAYWLPSFLDAWAAGRPVIDANFEANKAVVKPMGDSPAYSLAMSVFGDPLLVKRK